MEIFLRKYEEVMLSQCSVEFSLKNPNLESLTFEQILSFLDESWSTLDQMMNVTSKWGCWPKILKFDCMLTTVDFLSNTTDFQPSEQLSEETWLVRLETWHGDSLKHMRRHDDHWRCWEPILIWELPNPSLGWLLRRGFIWSTLVKSLSMDMWSILRSKRENFGVWQFPLFNLLVLEELD